MRNLRVASRLRPGRALGLAAAGLLASSWLAHDSAHADGPGAPPGPAPAVPAGDVAAAEALLAKNDAAGAAAAFRLLAERPGGGDDVRVQDGLASSLLALSDPVGAVGPLSALARLRGKAEDHARLAEALVAAAAEAASRGPTARSVDVVPPLRDALTSIDAGRAKAGDDAALAARLARVEGDARRWLGDIAGARKALSHPGLAHDASAQDLLARVCYEAKDFAAAAEAWSAAGNVRGAASSWAAGKDKRAVPAYLTLLRAAPGDEELGADAVAAALFVGDVDGLDAGLAAIPAEGLARASLERARGRLAETAGKPADAVPHYRLVLAARDGDLDAMRDLARARHASALTDPAAVEEAMALYRRVLEKAPDDETARRGITWQAATDGNAVWKDWPSLARLQRCVSLYEALVAADTSDGVSWAQLGNARRLAGDAKGAVEAFEKSVAANPFDASAWNDRGIAILAAGDAPAARASFEKASTLDPGDSAPHQNAGRLAWLAGDDDAAEAHYGAAARTARALGRKPMLFRFLLDRVWRTRVRPEDR